MLKRLYVVACLLLAACEMMSPPPSPTASDLRNTGVASQLITPTPDAAPQWIEADVNHVSVGVWQPSGWSMDNDDGLLLAEHAMSIGTGEPLGGAMIHIFVPEVAHLEIAPSAEGNFAMSVLQQVATNPEHIGSDVAVSEPTPFRWGAHEAAYYLITSAQGFRSMVLGISLPNDHERLVVINVTMPTDQSDHMRQMLPRVLHELTINGVALNSAALGVLPDPLVFPQYPHT